MDNDKSFTLSITTIPQVGYIINRFQIPKTPRNACRLRIIVVIRIDIISGQGEGALGASPVCRDSDLGRGCTIVADPRSDSHPGGNSVQRTSGWSKAGVSLITPRTARSREKTRF